MVRMTAGFVFAAAALSGMATPQVPRPRAPGAPGDHTVRGTVVSADGNTPLPRAEVALMEHDSVVVLVRTDTLGRFHLPVGDRSALTVRVRLLGYAPKVVPVHVAAGARMATIFVKLAPTADRLEAMHVGTEDEDYDANAAAGGFYDRKSHDRFGRYLDAGDIRRMHVQQLSDALRSIPGIFIKQSDRVVGNLVRVRNCVSDPNPTGAPLIFVDGVRAPGAELDEVARPNQVAGIEVYASEVGVPGQFVDQSAQCGTIVVWTRNY